MFFNKFRGDLDILKPGFRKLKQNTGKPVFGTIPLTKFLLPEEDSITSNSKQIALNSKNLKKIDSEIEKLSRIVKSSLNIRAIEKTIVMILESVVIVGFALLLDFLVGDPKTRYHPTAWIGKLIASIVPFTKSNSAKRELTGGILLVSVIVVTVCTILVVLDIGISLLTIDIVSLIVSIVVGSILLKTTIAIRGMQKTCLGSS